MEAPKWLDPPTTIPRRCGAPTHYEGQTYDCSLIRGHSGSCRNWVEDADLENETELSITNENERW